MGRTGFQLYDDVLKCDRLYMICVETKIWVDVA